jgi:hypothetical protein
VAVATVVISIISLVSCEQVNDLLQTDTAPPAEVSDLVATEADAQVTLTWTDPADADFDHVAISYGTGGNPDTAFTGTVDSAGTVIAGLTNDSEYSFLVTTVDTTGNESTGTTVTATPQAADTTPPAEVSDLVATAADAQVTLTWTDPADADFDHVAISYGTGGNPDTAFTGTVDSTGTVIAGLTNDSEYSFLVTTVDTTGNESAGTTVTATPQAASFSLDPADWTYYEQDSGSYVQLAPVPSNRLVSDAGELVFYANGFRGAYAIAPPQLRDFTGATLYATWKAYGGTVAEPYMGIGFLFAPAATNLTGWTGTQSAGFTTHSTYDGSLLIPADTWIYTRIVFTADGFESHHSWTNYDDSGGTEFNSHTVVGLGAFDLRPVFLISDNYGGTTARINVGELVTVR